MIALAGDRPALTVAPELAVFASTLGLSVAFVVGTEHESTIALRTVCTATGRRTGTERQNLLSYSRPPEFDPEWTGLTVTLSWWIPSRPSLWTGASLLLHGRPRRRQSWRYRQASLLAEEFGGSDQVRRSRPRPVAWDPCREP